MLSIVQDSNSSENTMASVDSLSEEDKMFLATCEELFKDRYTEHDQKFMKVFNAEPSIPPIVESWWVPNNSGRRNDRRHNRRFCDRNGPRGDHSHDNRGYGYRGPRQRY